jgi:hypothetical protein
VLRYLWDTPWPCYLQTDAKPSSLLQAAVATLIASVADVAAPGSRLSLDFLHSGECFPFHYRAFL